jgi:hypothetical protein
MDRAISPIQRALTNDSIGAKADKMKEESGTLTTIICLKITPLMVHSNEGEKRRQGLST